MHIDNFPFRSSVCISTSKDIYEYLMLNTNTVISQFIDSYMAWLLGICGGESTQCLIDPGFIFRTLSAASDRGPNKNIGFIQILR